MKHFSSLIAFALACSPVPTAACSMISSYRVPTNLELAERADTIILGIIEREIPGQQDWDSQLVVRPTILLKGTALPEEIRIGGHLSDQFLRAVASDPRDLYNPNANALAGACVRSLFDRGMLVLLFIERRAGVLELANYSFARTAEDIPSPDALWVKAVRIYVEIVALPQKQRKAALIARRDLLRASSHPDDKLLADDLDRQIRKKRIPPYD